MDRKHSAGSAAHSRRFLLLGAGALLVVGCMSNELTSAERDSPPVPSRPSFSFSLSSYFPPPEVSGGWRVATGAAQARALGMDSVALAGLGAYTMSLPYAAYQTKVSGYDPSNKATLIIKNGSMVGEFYNQPSARTGMYFLASNGKSITMMLTGHLVLDYPDLNLSGASRLYDQRWLPQGFPLSDPRKADITFDQVFRHISGIIPEAEGNVAADGMSSNTSWNFAPVTLGFDPDFPQSAPLYYDPGVPSQYAKGDPYSSVAFNHFSLLFRNITGVDASVYLRRALLDPIGVGPVAYMKASGMGDYVWATAGSIHTGARDYARLAYLLLHEGNWNGNQLFTPSWIQQFTTVPGYPNMRSNADCYWGAQYPKDLYRLVGSGVNLGFIVPSLDLIATFNGRTPNTMRDTVTGVILQKLFAAVAQQYRTCDGRTIDPPPPPPPPPQPAGIALKVTGRSDLTKQYMTLTWTGAHGTTVDMYRNGTLRKNTPNDGKQGDNKTFTGPATYIFKICEAGSYTCSNPASVSFKGGLLPPNRAPIAAFTYSCTDLRCSFTDGSVDFDGTLTSRSWSFGAGGRSTSQTAEHTYTTGGTYTVSLAVTDDRGSKGTLSKQITVVAPPPANVLPVADFSFDCTGLTCYFTDASHDQDGKVSSWSWDFGDGTSATDPSPVHDFSGGGNYQVVLRIKDDRNGSGEVTHSVAVSSTSQ
jgi:PKD repeat protein/CubicO group peptidase (beta-lactamase class C family)